MPGTETGGQLIRLSCAMPGTQIGKSVYRIVLWAFHHTELGSAVRCVVLRQGVRGPGGEYCEREPKG
eukprot:1604371-Rhodomonas_salina.2